MSQLSVLTELLEPAVKALGFELWGLEYLPSGQHSLLRIFIDHENGIQIDDCEKVSRQISAVLEVEEPIAEGYVLEVSSPGLDRTLFKPSQYLAYCGQTIFVRLVSPVPSPAGSGGSRKFKGVLKEVSLSEIEFDQKIILDVDGFLQNISFSNIQKAQVVPSFKV